VTVTVRRLGSESAAAAQRLSDEAFGVPPQTSPPTEPRDLTRPGRHWFGALDGGRLVAQACDREFDGWFGGRVLPVAGIAGVTVAVEDRGAGALAPLLQELLLAARDRGAVVSTLWASAPHIYRRTGYEVVAATRVVEVPSAVLGTVRATGDVRLRRAGVADAEVIRDLYDVWASGSDGALTRRGVSFPETDEELLAEFTGVTLAEDPDGRPLGYAAWVRGRGDGSGPELSVPDLVATHVDAYAALLRALATFGSVAPTIRLRTTGDDLVRLLVPSLAWAPVTDDLYSLKVLDVEKAFTGGRCTPGLTARLSFRVTGDVLPGVDGAYVLTAEGGSLTCVRGQVGDASAERTLAPRGLSLLVTGARPCRDLRTLGLLVGGDPAEDATWDAVVAGRVRGVLDHF
jgi:predicted acetyltransferase